MAEMPRDHYSAVAAAARTFPDAILEDPALEGPAHDVLDGEEARFSFDAPVHSWADVEMLRTRLAAALSQHQALALRFASRAL
jgi:hypothetical protein